MLNIWNDESNYRDFGDCWKCQQLKLVSIHKNFINLGFTDRLSGTDCTYGI